MDATRETLLKDYATGIQFSGPFVAEHCVACIIGKSPQHSYSHHGHRASAIGELLHMDLCGPYPIQTPDGKRHFYVILDDHSNFGFLHLLRLKSEAFPAYRRTEAFIGRSCNKPVVTVRVDGALELMKGDMATHFAKHGIVVQQTAPYAHQQAGKIERYVRTIEEGGQTLLADSGLSMSFWGWAVLTSQYLRNRLPTSTLAANTTPFQVFTIKKPDLSHLRVWGCQCFPAIPPELQTKAGPRRYEAIFIGYEEARVGWLVRDLKGKVSFSRDVIFNEDLSGRSSIPRTLSSMASNSSDAHQPLSRRPARDRIRTYAGRDYDEAMRLKELRTHERTQRTKVRNGGADRATLVEVGVDSDVDVIVGTDGGANSFVAFRGMSTNGGADIATNGGEDVSTDWGDENGGRIKGIAYLSYSPAFLADFISFLTPLSFPDDDDLNDDLYSLIHDESDILWNHRFLCSTPISLFLDTDRSYAFKAYGGPHRPIDLSKKPLSYAEAIA
jgi:hypothetical protein